MSALITDALNSFISIFVIVDPFAVIPVYLGLTDRYSEEVLRKIRRKATIVACAILSLFALTGISVFSFFGTTLPAFQIAGGLLLFKLALEQLGANRTRVKDEERDESLNRDDISIFPLATPLLAGPGAISTVVLQSSKAKSTPSLLMLIVAIVAAVALCNLVLKLGPLLYKVIGKTGLNLLTRLMGLILAAVSVQFVLNGLTSVVNELSKNMG
ncbi:MAG: NAAT family transporter [Betaproteobacteria bacterium]|nr:NAAT family transporter [Betaproteobacteria bacterium]